MSNPHKESREPSACPTPGRHRSVNAPRRPSARRRQPRDLCPRRPRLASSDTTRLGVRPAAVAALNEGVHEETARSALRQLYSTFLASRSTNASGGHIDIGG
jgi:hypothetical protein